MVFDWLLKRGKENKELKAAITHGVFTAQAGRPSTHQEELMNLGINIHTIEDDNIVQTINAFIGWCSQNGILDFHLFALRNLVTKLFRTSRLDRLDAYILMLQAEQILLDIEANLPDELITIGVLAYIDSIKSVLISAFCDAIGGWKAKLLKVSPRYFEITMPEAKKQKSWMGE